MMICFNQCGSDLEAKALERKLGSAFLIPFVFFVFGVIALFISLSLWFFSVLPIYWCLGAASILVVVCIPAHCSFFIPLITHLWVVYQTGNKLYASEDHKITLDREEVSALFDDYISAVGQENASKSEFLRWLSIKRAEYIVLLVARDKEERVNRSEVLVFDQVRSDIDGALSLVLRSHPGQALVMSSAPNRSEVEEGKRCWRLSLGDADAAANVCFDGEGIALESNLVSTAAGSTVVLDSMFTKFSYPFVMKGNEVVFAERPLSEEPGSGERWQLNDDGTVSPTGGLCGAGSHVWVLGLQKREAIIYQLGHLTEQRADKLFDQWAKNILDEEGY
jgi:hypothetical protein